MEWWALPGMVEEFSDWEISQYSDDERHVSREVKERVVPGVENDVPFPPLSHLAAQVRGRFSCAPSMSTPRCCARAAVSPFAGTVLTFPYGNHHALIRTYDRLLP